LRERKVMKLAVLTLQGEERTHEKIEDNCYVGSG
jgi:hypothetical protein